MVATEMSYIYGLLDPITQELRYVGKSVSPFSRFRKHMAERNKYDFYKDRWIRKLYGLNLKPELLIISIVPKNEWVFWEQFYISYFKAIGAKLTNCTLGGDQPPGTKNRKHTEEAKKKMSEAKKNKPIPWLNTGEERSESHRKNLSKSLKGRVSPNKGKKFDEVARNNMSKSHIGLHKGENHPMYNKNHSEETKKKISENLKDKGPNNYRVVIQLSKDNQFIKEWGSIRNAEEQLGINNISSCCSGKLNTAGGYKWKYKEDYGG